MNSARVLRWVLCCWLLASSGCATWGGGEQSGKMPTFTSRAAREQWWRSNKHRTEFVPGKGFAIAGIDGYFDANGRPMSPVSVQQPGQQVSYETYEGPEDDLPEVGSSSESSWVENLDPAVTFKRISTALGPAPDPVLARDLYQQGEKLFAEKKYDEAADKFKDAVSRAPESVIEEDGIFMQAECLFFTDHYPGANKMYGELISKYPSSRHLDRVVQRQFAIGRYWQKHHEAEPHWPTTVNLFNKTRPAFDTYGNALKAYESIRLNDPTGPLADDALMATANAHFLNGRWEDADYHYGLLRSEYADSEHQFQAHLLGLQCKLRKYQGPDYDGTPLEQAQKLVDQLFKQFPDQIEPERKRVEQASQQIAREMAMRDWSRGQYYDRLEQYGAAKFYYAAVIKAHPTTKLAEQARTRVAELKGEPDVPAQKMEWLVNLFPEARKEPVMAAGAGPMMR